MNNITSCAFSDQELWEYIREDIPYFDLTTHLLNPPYQKASLTIVNRDKIMVASTNEAARLAELLGCEVCYKAESGTMIDKDDRVLEILGDGESLHRAWRVCQVFLEYSCGLATSAHNMLSKAREANPSCEVLLTRKTFPFSKRFSMHALLAGGVMPHRLGLSESILIFDNHRALYENKDAFESTLLSMKKRCVENKLVVESHTLQDAKRMLELGVDVVQLDKCELDDIKTLVEYRDENYPNVSVVAAGGINIKNVDIYAKTGVDAVVTSSLYKSSMSDLSAVWKKL